MISLLFRSRVLLYLAVGLLICTMSCKKSGNDNKSPVVYVGGSISTGNGSLPMCWKNGVPNVLASPNKYGLVTAIALKGTDVFIAGATSNSIDSSVTTYWKNGAAFTLPIPGTNGGATAIAFSGTDFYITGFTVDHKMIGSGNPVPICWKNGIPDTLFLAGIFGRPTAMTVKGGDIYITGYTENNYVTYWKNGIETRLGVGFAKGIAISDSDVYIVGDIPSSTGSSLAGYWKNGSPLALSYTSPYYYASDANAVTISGSDIYVAGYTVDPNGNGDHIATYWKNNVPVTLSVGEANAIAVSGSDVYVAGYTYSPDGGMVPAYWKNGQLTTFPGYGAATAIAVSPL